MKLRTFTLFGPLSAQKHCTPIENNSHEDRKDRKEKNDKIK
jgi:hypothetical protein